MMSYEVLTIAKKKLVKMFLGRNAMALFLLQLLHLFLV